MLRVVTQRKNLPRETGSSVLFKTAGEGSDPALKRALLMWLMTTQVCSEKEVMQGRYKETGLWSEYESTLNKKL